MLHRSMSRLAVAAAAGSVCALIAASAATAGPTPPWSTKNPAVPNAFTNTTPALSEIQVNGQLGTFLAWKGQFDNKVQYKFKLNGHWYGTKVIPGARTNTSPSAALYTTKLGKEAVLVAWKGLGNGGLHSIKYSSGVVHSNGSIGWTKPAILPGGNLSETSASPALLFPANATHARVIMAYRGPGNHVRVAIGTEIGTAGRGFTWGTKKVKSAWISGSSNSLTSAQPALAEILGAGGNGTVYVFWTGEGKTAAEPISYATTPDLAGSGLDGDASLTWTLQGSVPDSKGVKGLAQTTGSPAVASADVHGDGPLLLAYKGPSGFNIRYQTFSAGVWATHLFVGGNNNTTGLGPALVHGVLVNVSRTDARMFLHHYQG